MPDQTPGKKELQRVTQPGANGQDRLDPRIAKMTEFLDRAIRTQDETVGVVVAAVGILLGRKGMNPDNLERLIYDVTTAIRVGFYLEHSKGK